MKKSRFIGRVLILVLVGASVVAAFLQRDPLAVAKEACAERGIGPDGLVLLGYDRHGRLLGRRETVRFERKGPGPAKQVVVELLQHAYFLPWQVLEVREEAGQ
jgi:hypothetical protein